MLNYKTCIITCQGMRFLNDRGLRKRGYFLNLIYPELILSLKRITESQTLSRNLHAGNSRHNVLC
jgi:hypothetical protein